MSHSFSTRAGYFRAAIVFVVLLAVSSPPARAAGEGAELPHVVVDRATGEVLAQNRATERWYPASLTKLMTVYVTLRAIAAGEIAPGSPVVMSALAAGQPPSSMGFKRGEKLRVDAAIRILIVKSANDVSVALAEAVAGTVPLFVERMNGEAARLGMRDTQFANPNGLHSQQQFTTARDLAILARALLAEFPSEAGYYALPAIRTGEKVHHSYNLLLGRFAGADGMKTGFVCASGYNIVASATRDGRQLLAVVLGAFSQTERAVAAARLLEEGFSRTGGKPLGAVSPEAVKGPTDQRPRMCSKEAYANRYDPGPGDARIDSPWLAATAQAFEPLEVALGPIDAPASEAALTAMLVPRGKVPVPLKRPDNTPRDVDGEPVVGAAPLRGAIPVPVFRPAG